MKILQLIQKPQRRGAEIFAIQLSEELIRLGHEVWVVSVFPGDSGLSFSGNWVSLNRKSSRRQFDLGGWREFATIIKNWQPDLIQANAADTLKFASFSKKIFNWGTPIIYRNANQMGDFIRGNLHNAYNQFLLNSVDSTVSVSEASKEDFQQTFLFPENKSVVIPIGIDTDEIERKSQEVHGDYDLPQSYLVQVGGLVPEKDPVGMLMIFSRLPKTHLHLVFLGSGSLEKYLREKIEELGLESRVHLIPNQSNIFPYLSKARALVMPTKIEGLPAVILEAMYLKIPVVAYGVGGIPEVLVTERTGWCIPPTDQKGFISAIEEVLSMDTQKKETILSNAYELVSTKFTLEKVARQFENFYSRLLNSPQKTDNN